jgi:hypothetical protein
MKLSKKEVNPFVLKIHFQVKFKSTDISRIESSTDEDVQYFLSINPGYKQQYGVLVLVPVTISNMLYTLLRYQWRLIKKATGYTRSGRQFLPEGLNSKMA